MRTSKKQCKELANKLGIHFWARDEFFLNRKPLLCLKSGEVFEFNTNTAAMVYMLDKFDELYKNNHGKTWA